MNNDEETKNQKINSEREEMYKSMPDDEKVKLLMRLSEENLLLKKLLFDVSKNKNYIIQKQLTDDEKIEVWTYEFLNKENISNGKKITIFYSKNLLNKFETLIKKDGE